MKKRLTTREHELLAKFLVACGLAPRDIAPLLNRTADSLRELLAGDTKATDFYDLADERLREWPGTTPRGVR